MKIFRRIAMGAVCLWMASGGVLAAHMLVPGGQVIGLQISQNTVTVAAFDEHCCTNVQKAGLRVGDQIKFIDGQQIQSAQDVLDALKRSDGSVDVKVCRDGKNRELKLTPEATSNGPRLGIYLRDGISGIGTLTWYDPDTEKFGTLGHGINDSSGKLADMVRGFAYEASVVSVKKGVSGDPGQLRGNVTSTQPVGILKENTTQGVFGVNPKGWTAEPLPAAEKGDVHPGKAMIRATVQGNKAREYSVEILKIYPKSGESGRNILLRVTDPELLKQTGGIVQGMSGSPIIQDGKLVGAVTHVLVNDPTKGYGIFIENMLDAAE